MALFKRGGVWWYKFYFAGQPIRESSKSTSKTVAKNAEQQRRRELETGFHNIKEVRQHRSLRRRASTRTIASMFGSYSEVRSNTSIAIENSLRLSISPSIVRFTMCVRNRHNRTDETKLGLFTTRANWSRTAVAGTGSAVELARDFSDDNGGVGTCFFPPFIMLHKASECYGELTSAYGQSKARGHSVEWGGVRGSMQTYRQAGTVIFVSDRSPEATVLRDIEARGLVVQWARSIRVAVDLLNSAREKTVIVTELALADGNWRDLVERMRGIDICVPILLATSFSTAELWWDALECGIDDILPGYLVVSRLCQLLETQGAS